MAQGNYNFLQIQKCRNQQLRQAFAECSQRDTVNSIKPPLFIPFNQQQRLTPLTTMVILAYDVNTKCSIVTEPTFDFASMSNICHSRKWVEKGHNFPPNDNSTHSKAIDQHPSQGWHNFKVKGRWWDTLRSEWHQSRAIWPSGISPHYAVHNPFSSDIWLLPHYQR